MIKYFSEFCINLYKWLRPSNSKGTRPVCIVKHRSHVCGQEAEEVHEDPEPDDPGAGRDVAAAAAWAVVSILSLSIKC